MSGSTEYLHEDVTVAQGWRVDGSNIELKGVVMRLSLGLLEGGEPCAHGGEIGLGRRVACLAGWLMLLEYSIRRRYEAGTGGDTGVLRAAGADGGGQQRVRKHNRLIFVSLKLRATRVLR
jgi:hypothetical protein